MNYFKYKNHYLFVNPDEAPCIETVKTDLPGLQPVSNAEAFAKADLLHFLFCRDQSKSKAGFALTDTSLIGDVPEGLHNLREGLPSLPALPQVISGMPEAETTGLCHFLKERRIRAINTAAPDFVQNLGPERLIYGHAVGAEPTEVAWPPNPTAPPKKRIHILALGDVGSILLLGLKLMGRHVISSIGIYDLSPGLMQRLEYEMNQMHYPDEPERMPPVEAITAEQLFDCDVFVFCASKSVPPLETKVQDVRLVQYEGNKAIIAQYAKMADEKKFKGIFAVVSDPVDLLCHAALFDDSQGYPVKRQNLRPEQIRGYGLGVMNSRGLYYAQKEERFRSFLTRGRCFGPHGKGLVLANDITCYNPDLSDELTELALHANLRTRETGFKPYLAPAISSGAISIILTLEGNWHYSANFLGGVYMGARNRILPAGLEIENIPMPDTLYEKLLRSYEGLKQKR